MEAEAPLIAHGSCLCGRVRFSVHGELRKFFLCHCSRCQKGTGSAHAANLFASPAQLNFLAGGDAVTHFRLPSTRHTKSFCASCGAALPYVLESHDAVVIPAGSLDSPVEMTPQAHIWCASRATWDHDLEKVPELDGLP